MVLSVSNSEITLFKSCKRSWYMQYYLGRQAPVINPVSATQLGTRVHAALEGYYNPNIHNEPVGTLRAIYDMDVESYPDYEEELRTEEQLAEAMVSGYTEWLTYTGCDQGLEVIGVEQQIEIPFEQDKLGDVYLRARLDMRVRLPYGGIMFMDHKTCQTFLTEDYLDRDEQARFYMMLQRLSGVAAGEWVQGGVFNMLRKVKRSSTAKPPFYKREYVEFNNHVMNAQYYRTYAVVKEIVEARARLAAGEDHNLVVYPSPGKDCVWRCPLAAGICSMMDDGSDWRGASDELLVQVDPYARYSEHSYLDKLDQAGMI